MDQAIRKAFGFARETWPTIELPSFEQYDEHVRLLQMSARDLDRHAADVFLALACGLKVNRALLHLETTLLPQLDHQLTKSHFAEAERRDALQQLLENLCTGDRPRILSYAGKASLVSWLCVIVLRLALQMRRRGRVDRVYESDRVIDELVSGDTGPEMRLAIESSRHLLQRALSNAIESLPDRDRTILRLSFVDGLAIDGIGTLYDVHRATAARWIAEIRQRILREVESTLRIQHGMNASELRSLIAIARSHMHVSLARVLGVS